MKISSTKEFWAQPSPEGCYGTKVGPVSPVVPTISGRACDYRILAIRADADIRFRRITIGDIWWRV